MSNSKVIYVVLLGNDEVIAHIYKSDAFGLVVIFLENKIDITKSIEIYDLEKGKLVEDTELLNLILSPFSKAINVNI